MDLTEKMLESKIIYRGRIVTLREDVALLGNGAKAGREVVEHPGGVAVLPLEDDGTVITVRQFRYPFGRVVEEVPAGKLDKRGEDPREAALRELSEEVGAVPDQLIELGTLLASPGISTEVLHLYLARGLRHGECHPDEDEFLEILRTPLDELYERVMTGELEDAKTVAILLKGKEFLRREGSGKHE